MHRATSLLVEWSIFPYFLLFSTHSFSFWFEVWFGFVLFRWCISFFIYLFTLSCRFVLFFFLVFEQVAQSVSELWLLVMLPEIQFSFVLFAPKRMSSRVCFLCKKKIGEKKIGKRKIIVTAIELRSNGNWEWEWDQTDTMNPRATMWLAMITQTQPKAKHYTTEYT